MGLQANAIVLGVQDMERAKKFYGEGLGCPIDQDHGQFVSFKLGDGEGASVLGLYARQTLADEAGVPAEGSGFPGVTLHHLVDSRERVDEVMGQAKQAGATVTNPAKAAPWGGYFGYFSDPDGYLWKVATSA